MSSEEWLRAYHDVRDTVRYDCVVRQNKVYGAAPWFAYHHKMVEWLTAHPHSEDSSQLLAYHTKALNSEMKFMLEGG